MKTYNDLQEFLKDNPDPKTLQKLLKIVNKKNTTQLKKEHNKKVKALEQLEKQVEQMKIEVKNLEEMIGQPIEPKERKPRTKKVKV